MGKVLKDSPLRILTAVTGLATLGGIYYFFTYYGLLFITITIIFLAYSEFLSLLLDKKNSFTQKKLKIFISLVAAALSLYPFPFSYYCALLIILLSTLFFAKKGESHHLPDALFSIFGLIYIVSFLRFVPNIYQLKNGPVWLLSLMLMIWIGDSFSYFGGRLWGKKKLSPISPGKTLEGSLCGVVGTFLVSTGMHYFYFVEHSLFLLLILGLLTSVLAQSGDLLESLFKRNAGVKDSGFLLPGHGGFLDRFDSLILSAPFYYIFIKLFWET